jgi:2-iminobutanoate/2-iminopropanoate deaminase
MRTVIHSGKAPAAIGPYSQAIAAGDFLFVSGQLPVNPESGNIESSDIRDLAKQSLENAKAILEEGGVSLQNVVKTVIFLTDMSDFGAVNEIYSKYFPYDPPARSCVEVGKLPKSSPIEIEMIAYREE